MRNIVRVCADEKKENIICFDFENNRFYNKKIKSGSLSIIALAGISSGLYAFLNYLTGDIGIDFSQTGVLLLTSILCVIVGLIVGYLSKISIRKSELESSKITLNNVSTIMGDVQNDVASYKKVSISFCILTICGYFFSYLSNQISVLLVSFFLTFISTIIIVFSDFRKKYLFLKKMKGLGNKDPNI